MIQIYYYFTLHITPNFWAYYLKSDSVKCVWYGIAVTKCRTDSLWYNFVHRLKRNDLALVDDWSNRTNLLRQYRKFQSGGR